MGMTHVKMSEKSSTGTRLKMAAIRYRWKSRTD